MRIGLIGSVWRNSLFETIDASSLPQVVNQVNIADVKPVTGKTTRIEVTAEDTIAATIRAHAENGSKIAVLNFASFKRPGGGFLDNAMAQEEAICYCSNLYQALAKEQEWYDKHKTKLNNGAYTHESILSQNVTILADKPGHLLPHEDWFTVDILTCACANWSSVLRYRAWDTEAIRMLQKASFDRVLYLMHILSSGDYDTVILGAFGCGVFKNDPRFIAGSFKYAIEEVLPGSFSRVVFAVPDSSSDNYRAFTECFNSTETSVFV